MSVSMEQCGGRYTHLPFHKKTTKETRLNAVWVDSMLVIQSQSFRRLSEEGASGQALDMALFLSRVWMYGTRTVRNPWISSRLRGSPAAASVLG